VTTASSPYGQILVVGSGQFAGYSLYVFSNDAPSACTTTVVSVLGMPLSCAGAETDKTADWPALTTDGPPVAGPGVSKQLLSTVYRSDIGAHQVTYGGHLLYLFDPAPHQFTGQAFPETVSPLPPWHGVWYLASPTKGRPVAGTRTLAPQTLLNGKTVVSAIMYPDATSIFQNSEPIAFTAYSYSKDIQGRSACTGSCARTWLPVLSSSTPHVTGLAKSAVGTIVRPDGTRQVTYHHKPLYLYSLEVPRIGGSPPGFLNPATTGNGNGVRGPRGHGGHGGTFSTVPL
jgi:hypothetical protein